MAPKLYMIHGSPPCRTVITTAKALGIALEMKEVDFEKGEHLRPEFLKINPQHTVPVLEDDGKIICDSHAIITYLVDKYGKDDSFYPKDLYKRALVNEKLFFNVGSLFSNMKVIWALFMNKEVKTVPSARAKALEDNYAMLEKGLEGRRWAVGDSVTVADISLYTSISSSEILVKVDPETFPNITEWFKRVKDLPWFEGDDEEVKAYVTWFNSLV